MAEQGREIQELSRCLSKAQDTIERLSKVKSEFVSVVTHELRTPLTAIKESVSLVLEGVAGPINENQQKFLAIAKNNIDRLSMLIADILDFSKLESAMIIMHKKKININEVIKDICGPMQSDADKKHIRIMLELADNLSPAWLDPVRIGQVLRNLISNAIKFGNESGQIRVLSLMGHDNGREFVKVIVEDNGIGMTNDETEKLFNNFTPLDASMTRKQGGVGLGLVIAKGIIDLHAGNISVESAKGAGTKFTFTIPVYKKDEEFNFLMDEAIKRANHEGTKLALILLEIKDEKYRTKDMLNDAEDTIKRTVRGPQDKVTTCRDGTFIAVMANSDRNGAMEIIKRLNDRISIPLNYGISIYPDQALTKEDLIKNSEQELKIGANTIMPKKILLIIDDEEDLTSALSFRLQSNGFETFTANEGPKGVDMAIDTKPDLILLDLMMPNVDGLEIFKRLRNNEYTRHIPILLFTALKKIDIEESIRKIDAAGFIEKPFEPEELLKKINNILEVADGQKKDFGSR